MGYGKRNWRRLTGGEISFKDERVVTALDKINDLFAKEYAYPGNGAFLTD